MTSAARAMAEKNTFAHPVSPQRGSRRVAAPSTVSTPHLTELAHATRRPEGASANGSAIPRRTGPQSCRDRHLRWSRSTSSTRQSATVSRLHSATMRRSSRRSASSRAIRASTSFSWPRAMRSTSAPRPATPLHDAVRKCAIETQTHTAHGHPQNTEITP